MFTYWVAPLKAMASVDKKQRHVIYWGIQTSNGMLVLVLPVTQQFNKQFYSVVVRIAGFFLLWTQNSYI